MFKTILKLFFKRLVPIIAEIVAELMDEQEHERPIRTIKEQKQVLESRVQTKLKSKL